MLDARRAAAGTGDHSGTIAQAKEEDVKPCAAAAARQRRAVVNNGVIDLSGNTMDPGNGTWTLAAAAAMLPPLESSDAESGDSAGSGSDANYSDTLGRAARVGRPSRGSQPAPAPAPAPAAPPAAPAAAAGAAAGAVGADAAESNEKANEPTCYRCKKSIPHHAKRVTNGTHVIHGTRVCSSQQCLAPVRRIMTGKVRIEGWDHFERYYKDRMAKYVTRDEMVGKKLAGGYDDIEACLPALHQGDPLPAPPKVTEMRLRNLLAWKCPDAGEGGKDKPQKGNDKPGGTDKNGPRQANAGPACDSTAANASRSVAIAAFEHLKTQQGERTFRVRYSNGELSKAYLSREEMGLQDPEFQALDDIYKVFNKERQRETGRAKWRSRQSAPNPAGNDGSPQQNATAPQPKQQQQQPPPPSPKQPPQQQQQPPPPPQQQAPQQQQAEAQRPPEPQVKKPAQKRRRATVQAAGDLARHTAGAGASNATPEKRQCPAATPPGDQGPQFKAAAQTMAATIPEPDNVADLAPAPAPQQVAAPPPEPAPQRRSAPSVLATPAAPAAATAASDDIDKDARLLIQEYLESAKERAQIGAYERTVDQLEKLYARIELKQGRGIQSGTVERLQFRILQAVRDIQEQGENVQPADNAAARDVRMSVAINAISKIEKLL